MVLETSETVEIRLHAADLLNKLPQAVPHRIGNWTEESVLREEQLKDFFEKYEKGLSSVAKTERRFKAARREQILSPKLAFDSNIMLKNIATNGFLSVDVPETYPDYVTDQDIYSLTTAPSEMEPIARCCWKFVKFGDDGSDADGQLRFGEKYYIVVTEELVDLPMYLTSEPKSFASFAKISKGQPAFLTFRRDSRSLWQIDYPDPNLRPEMEGEVVKHGKPVLIRHCNTGNCLSSDMKHIVRSEFGVEYEAGCQTYRDFGTRIELEQNQWILKISD